MEIYYQLFLTANAGKVSAELQDIMLQSQMHGNGQDPKMEISFSTNKAQIALMLSSISHVWETFFLFGVTCVNILTGAGHETKLR